MILSLYINNRKEKQIIRPWLKLKKAISIERENDNEKENAKNKLTNKQTETKQKKKHSRKRTLALV